MRTTFSTESSVHVRHQSICRALRRRCTAAIDYYSKYYSKAAYDLPAAPYNTVYIYTVFVMDNLRRLLEDEEDASSQSTLTWSDDSEGEELFPPEPQDNFTSESDDDGYDSVGNSSEPEEIIVDKRFPTPERPPPSSMPFILNNGDVEPIFLMRVPRRQEDLHQPYSRKLSYGYEDTGHPLRRGIRSSELVEGQGMFNGYKHHLMPIRISGCFKKRRQLFYFVEWEGRDGVFPLEASIVARRSPRMVIRYHQDFIYNPSRFRHL